MTIETGVPSSFLPPGTFHTFNYLRSGGALVNVPLTVALVGMKSSAGTGVVGTVYEVKDPVTSDALAGVGSEAALMCRQGYLCSRIFRKGAAIKLVLLAAQSGGGAVANVQTLTFVGTAGSDGNVIVRVAGRTFTIGVRNGATETVAALAVSNKLKEKAETLPVVVSVAAGVVTFTHPTTGVNGIDVVISMEQQVAGLTGTVATTVVGVGVSDITGALAALAPLRYDGIAIANHAAADITAILLDAADRWAAESKNWGWYFLGERGTIGTATSLAAAANHRAVIVSNMEGCLSAPGEIATASAMLVFSRSRPNAGYDGARVPLFPPGTATWYTPAEQNTAITAGLTVYVGVKDSSGAVTGDRAKCVQMVTTKTTISSVPDDRNRDIAVSRTGVALAIQLDIATEIALGAENNPEGVNQRLSEPLLRDLASAILRAEARATPPVISPLYVEEDVEAIQIEPEAATLGRNNVRIPYHVETPLHQVAWAHDVIIGP